MTGIAAVALATIMTGISAGGAQASGAQASGTAWTVVRSPNATLAGGTVPSDATVNSVSCASAAFCEAVGSGPAYTWNGSDWTPQTIPAPAGTGSLGGVSCASPGFCEAVGEAGGSNNNVVGKALVEVRDGATWSLQSSPDPSPAHDLLSGVSCGASQACTAVGQAQDAGGVESTLIETGD